MSDDKVTPLNRVHIDRDKTRKELASFLRRVADEVENGNSVDPGKSLVLLLDDRGDDYNFHARAFGLYGSEAVALLEISRHYYCSQIVRSR